MRKTYSSLNPFFANAFGYILKTLDKYRERIDYKNKNINGLIEFKLSGKGYPEELNITADNLTDTETEFLYFLMKKFKNIDMPGTEAIAVEEYHKIYFYTINMGRFMPGGLKAYAKQEIFFAPIKREQFLSILNAKKKQIKKYLRGDFLHYW